MSALPDEYPAAEPAAPHVPEPQHSPAPDPASGEAEVRNLYSIPRPEPAPPRPSVWERVQGEITEFTPPRFWSEPIPSVSEELNRARHGKHLQATGPMRTAAVAYTHVAAVFTTRDQLKIWLRAHPARAAVVVVLIGALLLTPARPLVVWILFGVPHLAFEVLSG